MNFPKPLQYSLSAVLLAIGFAIAYQVLIGNEVSIKSQLGEFEVGKGENKRKVTIDQVLNETESALESAQLTINKQEIVIAELTADLNQYENDLLTLKGMIRRLSGTNNNDQSRRLSSVINSSVEKLKTSSEKTAQIKSSPVIAKTKIQLKNQELLISAVRDKLKTK